MRLSDVRENVLEGTPLRTVIQAGPVEHWVTCCPAVAATRRSDPQLDRLAGRLGSWTGESPS